MIFIYKTINIMVIKNFEIYDILCYGSLFDKSWRNIITSNKKHEEYRNNESIVIVIGGVNNSTNVINNKSETEDFLTYYNNLNFKNKIYSIGFNDTAFKNNLIDVTKYPNIIFLNNSSISINGINFFGTPYHCSLYNYTYRIHKLDNLIQHRNSIPNCTDVLISPFGPKYQLDEMISFKYGESKFNSGDITILKYLEKNKNIKFNIFSNSYNSKTHNIYNRGVKKINGINAKLVNCTNKKLNIKNSEFQFAKNNQLTTYSKTPIIIKYYKEISINEKDTDKK